MHLPAHYATLTAALWNEVTLDQGTRLRKLPVGDQLKPPKAAAATPAARPTRTARAN